MKNTIKKQCLALLISILFLGGQISPGISLTKAAAEPYQRTFVVTAYYSPLPGQKYYVTGSLASDKRLNGNGTHGADGTPVYPGMIAAPSIYSFGTRISCPGYIDGEIHDRGGAIVKAGQRGYAHDRLDFWAGHGDAALKTALFWGKRTLTCTVYPTGTSPAFDQYVSLPNSPKSYGKAQMAQRAPNLVQTTTSTTTSSRYNKILNDLGYDADDKASRIAFQMRHGIIESPTETVAGNIGPATKAKLDAIASKNTGLKISEGLKEGNVSNDVRILQEALIEKGFLKEASTAIFGPATKEALIAYQIDAGLIPDASHSAAGYVGPGTKTALEQVSNTEFLISAADKELIKSLNIDKIAAESLAKANNLDAPEVSEEEYHEDFTDLLEDLSHEWIKEHTPDVISSKAKVTLAAASTINPQLASLKAKLAPVINPFSKHLQVGSVGDDVEKLQGLLKNIGYFEGKQLTNYFGPQTEQAIIAFQIDQQIVSSNWSAGAGQVGPKTVQALNASFYQQQFSLPVAEGKSFRAPAIHPEDLIPTQPLQQAQANTAS